jgi:hypothetical protein
LLLAKAGKNSREVGFGEELAPAVGDIVWMTLHDLLKRAT